MVQAKYRTQPLQCWQRAKELRTDYFKSIMTAREEDKLLVMVDSGSFIELPAGLGDYVATAKVVTELQGWGLPQSLHFSPPSYRHTCPASSLPVSNVAA